jgi:hypothetical protein
LSKIRRSVWGSCRLFYTNNYEVLFKKLVCESDTPHTYTHRERGRDRGREGEREREREVRAKPHRG